MICDWIKRIYFSVVSIKKKYVFTIKPSHNKIQRYKHAKNVNDVCMYIVIDEAFDNLLTYSLNISGI